MYAPGGMRGKYVEVRLLARQRERPTSLFNSRITSSKLQPGSRSHGFQTQASSRNKFTADPSSHDFQTLARKGNP